MESRGPTPGATTVLVAEDNELIRTLLCQVLTEAGFRVLAAANGALALTAARGAAHPVDLLVTDIVMPKLNGPDLAAILRAEAPALRVLYITGYAEHLDDLPDVLDGTALLLQKPFDPFFLVACLQQMLHSPRA